MKNLISKKEALESLANSMQKQIVETEWEIERIKPLSKKEFEEFQGKTAQKKEIEKLLINKLKEREKNLEVISKMIKKYE